MRRFAARFLAICAIALCLGGGFLVEDAEAGRNTRICDSEGFCRYPGSGR